MEEKLNAQGILNLGDLLDALTTPDRLPPLLALKGFTMNKVDLWTGVLRDNLLDGACPPDINHKIQDNPYLSRYPHHPDAVLNEYGEKEWEAKISESPTCKKYVCIVRLIEHMFRETAKIFVDTVHEDDWILYHDALTLFTAAESMQYMRAKGYLNHLILPQHRCNAGTPYANRMVGMRPEVMPLDAHLNQDIHESVDRHVNLTAHLPDNHPNKFGKRTPKQLSKAYRRVWDPALGPDAGAPTSRRIKQDVDRVVYKTYLEIFHRRGRVLNTAAYLGRRAQLHNERVAAPWGGKRIKGDGPVRTYWVHPDIKDYEEELMEGSRSQYLISMEE